LPVLKQMWYAQILHHKWDLPVLKTLHAFLWLHRMYTYCWDSRMYIFNNSFITVKILQQYANLHMVRNKHAKLLCRGTSKKRFCRN
jgi:hypothetical protein